VASPVFGEIDETGGGVTLAAGYEFHHRRNLAMDLHFRATHSGFDGGAGKLDITIYTGLLGVSWF
jgi:hypothetical protein